MYLNFCNQTNVHCKKSSLKLLFGEIYLVFTGCGLTQCVNCFIYDL